MNATSQPSRLKEILRKLMSEVNINEAELARKTNIPQPTLHRILSGSTRSPRGNSLSPLANFFSVTISQLIGDDPLSLERIPGTYNPSISGWTSIPLISWEDALDWPNIHANLRSDGWNAWSSTDATVSPMAFALRVKGEAMAPRFPEGTLLIVDPEYKPQDKDFVVVKVANQSQATFKQLLFDGDDAYLKPLNPEFNTARMDKRQTILGVMIQARVDMVDIYQPTASDEVGDEL